jgi:O-antigen ligase
VWALERALNGRGERLTLGPRPALWAGLAVIAASALSLWHSVDVGLTLAFVTHLCLLAGLYLLWLNHPPGVRRLGVLFGVVVVVQGAVALAQVLAQSSVIPRELGLMWPGAFTAQTPGASVVLNAADARWLRAYGTLSHPNLLGALMLVYLGAVVERWLTTGKRRWLLLLGLGGVTLALTFSRAAWLGALALALAAWFLVPRAARDRLRVALALSAGLGLIAVLPLLSFLLGRLNLTQPANRLETASTLERTLLAGYALQAWQAAPLTGVGAGGFVQWAARYTGEAYPFQPVHTVPLLILAETGALGGAAALALFGIVMARAWRMRRALTVAGAVWSAVLVAILVAGLFDHLWWTQPPARVLAVIALAQWMSETP